MANLFTSSPVWIDNGGQLLSREDLEILRDNAAYCETLSYRLMPGFVSSGGSDSRTPSFYPTDGTFSLWYGNIRMRTGLTVLTIEGTAANTGGASMRVYVNGALRISVAAAATWTGSWTFSGFAADEVAEIRVDAYFASGSAPSNAKYVITAIYASPITYTALTWPGVPTFTTAWTAAKLNQLCDAMEWVYGRANATPIRPDLSLLHQLGPYSGESRPMYYGSIGRWFSNSQFRYGGNVFNGSSPGLQLEVYFNSALVYTSPNFAIGTTAYSVAISLAAYSVGQQIEVAVFLNNTVAAAQALWTSSRLTLNAARSEVNTSAVYSSLDTTPPVDVAVARTTVAAFLNDLSATVLAAHDRIEATPAVFGRQWAQRRFFSKTNVMKELSQKRGRPRFIRTGDRVVVRGKGVSISWGPIKLPTNEAGLDFDNYTFLHTQSIIDSDKIASVSIPLDTLPGLTMGLPYYLIGDVSWCQEALI